VDKKGQPTMTSHLHSPRSKAAQGDRREKQDKKKQLNMRNYRKRKWKQIIHLYNI